MMDHVEIDCPVEFKTMNTEGPLPSIVIPVEFGRGDQVDPRLRNAEVNALQVDTGLPRIASNGIKDPLH
jgi:hypothetical protein